LKALAGKDLLANDNRVIDHAMVIVAGAGYER